MSLYYDILTEVKAEIESLYLTGLPAVEVRKRPHIKRTDTMPLVIVSPGFEQFTEEYTENLINTEYPVLITIVQTGDHLLETAVAQMLDYRTQIRKHFHKAVPFTNVQEVIDSRVMMNKAFDPQLFGANYDASQVIFFFKATEPRDDT